MNNPVTPLFHRTAVELIEEIHSGQWLHVTQFQTALVSENNEVIAEFRSRCPGFLRAEYEQALARALGEYRPASAIHIFRSWMIAFTFVWALLVSLLIPKDLVSGWGGVWFGLLSYPIVCLTASIFLLTKKGGKRLIFAAINLVSGAVWAGYVIWAVKAFARTFWR